MLSIIVGGPSKQADLSFRKSIANPEGPCRKVIVEQSHRRRDQHCFPSFRQTIVAAVANTRHSGLIDGIARVFSGARFYCPQISPSALELLLLPPPPPPYLSYFLVLLLQVDFVLFPPDVIPSHGYHTRLL